MYKNLITVSTRDMTHEQWLEERKKGIGGSDAPTVLGLNEYCSPYSLWAEKTGKLIPEDISDKEVVRLGNDLEAYAAERWAEKTGKKVRRWNSIIRNPDYPYAHANVDRLVVGEDSGLELKTTSSWDIAKQCKDGNFPDRYYAQCVHYLMVTGAKRWHLGVLCFGTGFFDFTIERDEAEIAALAEAERVFWTCVTEDRAPGVDGTKATTDALKTIYKDSTPGSTIDLTAVGHHIESFNSLGKQIKELKALQDEQANLIKDFMADSEKGTFGNLTVSWQSSSRRTFDKNKYEELNGKIADEYYKTSETRTFKVTEKKGKK